MSKSWMSYQGRLARAPFWWGFAALWSGFAVLSVFLERSLGHGSTLVLYPPFFWIGSLLIVKRLHDRGKSAWWFWVVLIPVLGALWLIVSLGFRAGTIGDNHFGDDPRTVNVDYFTVK